MSKAPTLEARSRAKKTQSGRSATAAPGAAPSQNPLTRGKPERTAEEQIERKRVHAEMRIERHRDNPPLLATTAPVGTARPAGRLAGLGHALRHPAAFLRGGLAAAREAAEPELADPSVRATHMMTLADYYKRYFNSEFIRSVSWMGVPALKMVTDLWIYQEILHRMRPDVVIEIGSHYGGSTLFIANMLDLIGHGEVVSVDISRAVFMVDHPRVTQVTGDSGDPAVVRRVAEIVAGRTAMVVHDADHSRAAVARDLDLYADFVSPGHYLVIEDAVVDIYSPSRYRLRGIGEGPLPAIRDFLARRGDAFTAEPLDQRFVMTASHFGYLRRRGLPSASP